MLDEKTIKSIFMQSDSPRDNALIATEVDIVQFAHRIEEHVALQYARQERDICVEFVRSLNNEVARALEEKRRF